MNKIGLLDRFPFFLRGFLLHSDNSSQPLLNLSPQPDRNSDSAAAIQLFETHFLVCSSSWLSARISMHYSQVLVVGLCTFLSFALFFSRMCANQ